MAVVMSDTIQEAADKLGISRQQTHNRITTYGLKDKIAALKENAIIELQVGAEKAARKLVTLVDSQNENIARAASDSVLDRVGLTKQDTGLSQSHTFIQINNQLKEKYGD